MNHENEETCAETEQIFGPRVLLLEDQRWHLEEQLLFLVHEGGPHDKQQCSAAVKRSNSCKFRRICV